MYDTLIVVSAVIGSLGAVGVYVTHSFCAIQRKEGEIALNRAQRMLSSDKEVSEQELANTYEQLQNSGYFLPKDKQSETRELMDSIDARLGPLIKRDLENASDISYLLR